MTGKHFKILKTLPSDGTPMTAGALSVCLKVSLRSIKKYIAEIGAEYPGLIRSTSKGYCVQKEQLDLVLNEHNIAIPETSEERALYIINRLLEDKSIDLFELEQELFVSGETIRKDLALVRRRLKEFDLFLEPSGSTIDLGGDEMNKRKMMSDILFEEFNKNVLNISSIQSAFPCYDVAEIKELLLEICNKYHYFVNEYAINNLVLDLTISIDRIRSNTLSRPPDKSFDRIGEQEKAVAREIVSRLETLYDVTFNKYELDELTILLFVYLDKLNYKNLNPQNIEETIGKPCIELVEKLKSELGCFTMLDAQNEELMLRFILHIHNLILRLEGKYITKNPLTEHIKSSCPLIFEYAVEIADAIQRETGYYVGQHETAYIALHIGGMLESQQTLRNKVTCIIIYPQYYDLANRMAAQLTDAFDKTLLVKGIATSEDEIGRFGTADLMISTIQLLNEYQASTVLISPFLTERDISAVKNKIDLVMREKKRMRIEKNLRSISDPALFSRNMPFKNEAEAIRFMSGKLCEAGYVDENFTESVLERELRYSTAYGAVAVPHSMKMTAKKTKMYVALSEKPVSWGEGKVNIMLLFSISKEERGKFYEIFDNLIVLLLESQNAARIMRCKSYEEFIATIIQCY